MLALSTVRLRKKLGLPLSGLPLLSVWVAACSGAPAGETSVNSAPGAQGPSSSPAQNGSVVSPGSASSPGVSSPGVSSPRSSAGAGESVETPLAPEDNGPILGGPGTYGGGAANPANVNLGPFRSMRTAANDNRSFIAPIAGVDLGADQTALLALRRDAAGFGVFKASARGRVSLLNDGVRFIAPADLERRGEELLVADRVAPGGTGGIFSISVDTGEVAAEVLAEGFQPASLTVDALGNVLFSGRDLRTGLPGVFRFEGSGAVETIFRGAPLSDPSGVALKADGTVLVADTSFQGSSVGAIFALQNGAAEVVATGFATGFPAGIALTRDESSVVVSGEGADGFDRLFVVDVASGERSTVQANFSSVQGSSGGLHRLPDSDTFVWSSGSFNGGTVFRLED